MPSTRFKFDPPVFSHWGRLLPLVIGLLFSCRIPGADAQAPAPELAPSDAAIIDLDASDNLFEDYVLLTWPKVSNIQIFYRIKRDGLLLSVVSSQDNSYKDLSGTPGVTYNYCVAEVNAADGTDIDLGCDAGSRIINPPTNLVATDNLLEGGVLLSWSDESFIETGYYISRDGTRIDSVGANNGGYMDETAAPGVSYDYCVSARDAKYRESTNICDSGKRAFIRAPGNVAATDGQDPARILITWVDATDREVGYIIRRRPLPAGQMVELETTSANVHEYADVTAASGMTFEYCVSAVDIAGNESAQVCDEGNRGLLEPPQNVAASDNLFDDRVRITWEDASNTEDGFRITRLSAAPPDIVNLGSVGPNVTTFIDLDAEPGKLYSYCVVAYTNLGAASEDICDDGARSKVLAPTNVQASDGNYEDAVEVTWESDATSVILFKVFRDGTVITTVPASARFIRDSDIAPGIGNTHTYAVSAVTAFEDESPQSSDTGYRQLNAPTDVVAGDLDNEAHVMVTWKDNSFFELGYRILRKIGNGNDLPTEIGTGSVNATAYLDDTGASGVEYEYFVEAYDATGSSSHGSDSGGREIPAPTFVEASDGDYETKITVKWVDNAHFESGYKIKRRPMSGGIFTLIGQTTENVMEFDDASVAFGQSYEYSVTAFDNFGSSDEAIDTGFTVIQPPSTVLATDTYLDKVVVTWIDDSGIESGYRVYRDAVQMATTGPGVTTWTDTGTALDVIHTYCVKTFVQNVGSTTYSEETCDTGVRSTAPVVEGDLPALLTKEIPSGPGAYDLYGYAVAVDGNYALVSAPHIEFNEGPVGAVYSYKWDGSAWVYLQKLSGGVGARTFGNTFVETIQAGDRFGYSVSMSGNYAVIGAPGTDIRVKDISNPFEPPTTYNHAGVALVFERQGDVWSLVTRLYPTRSGGQQDGAQIENDGQFGKAVDIDETDLIIGAPDVSGAGYLGNGAAWSYQRVNGTWTERTRFSTATMGQELSKVGYSVAVSDGRLMIGFGGGYYAISADLSSNPNINTYSGTLPVKVAMDGDRALAFSPEDGFVRAYRLFGAGSSWNQTQLLLPADNEVTQKSTSLALSGSTAIIGASSNWHVFSLDSDTEEWTWTRKVGIAGAPATAPDTGGNPNTLPINGTRCAISGNNILFGYPEDYPSRTLFGSVFYEVAISPPAEVTASNGTFSNRVLVKWKDKSTNEDGFHVYREFSGGGGSVLLDDVAADMTSYSDFDAQPGQVYKYCIQAFNTVEESPSACDFGYIPPNGSITGRVTTRRGAAVANVAVCLDPSPTAALLFDGDLGVVVAPVTHMPDLTDLSIEFWARTNKSTGTVLSYGDGGSNPAIRISNFSTPRLEIGGQVFQGPAPLNLNDNTWHHYAWTWESNGGSALLYIDGEPSGAGSLSAGAMIPGEGITTLGHDFQGQLDEVRIWNVVRSEQDMQAAYKQKLHEEEPGLVVYWPMDERTGTVVTDITVGASYATISGGVSWTGNTPPEFKVCGVTDSEGNYALNDIVYGNETTFRVTPEYPARQFDPAFKSITLNENSSVQNEVAFTDISSFTVEGFVRFLGAGYSCPEGGVDILVDDVRRGVTGPDGRYSFPVDLGEYVIKASLPNHQFSQPRLGGVDVIGTLTVDEDTFGLNFEDNTMSTLSGVAAGGCPGASIGVVDYEIRAENGCLILAGNADGPYSELLPAQKYTVIVKDVDPPDDSPLDRAAILDFFNRIGPKTVDLTNGNAVNDFIYHAPLDVVIEGFDNPSCSSLYVPGNPTPLMAVPIVDQGEAVPLIVRVYEDYGNGIRCPIESASVTIFDEIIDQADTPVSLQVLDGLASYTTIGNTPNIFKGRRDSQGNDRSYQKPITFVVEAEGQKPVTKTLWTVVTGHRPRVATFTSTSQPEPLLILRDPPGDGSYAFIEEGTTTCTKVNNFEVYDVATGFNLKLKTGLNFFSGAPGWFSETKIADQTENKFRVGIEATDDDGVQICATATERISTSDSEVFVNGRGDIFMGIAMNFVFTKTDVVDVVNSQGLCTVVKSEAISLGGDGFETTYLYTEDHIRNVLIPQNKEFAQDNTDGLGYFFDNSAKNWEHQLFMNDSLKTVAEFVKNRSFSAGAEFDYTATSDTTNSHTNTTKVYSNNELALGFNFSVGGSGSGFQFVVDLKFQYTHTTGEDTTFSHTTGYHLADNDVGDYFSVDIKDDKLFNTPVFDVRSGRSSCPWEPWPDPVTGQPRTGPRERAKIEIEPGLLLGVPPDKPAVFTLTLTNDSESEELREYMILPIQNNNPGGAIIKANGAAFARGQSFFIDGDLDLNTTSEVTLSVERGPNRYRYDNLAIMMVPPCEFENFRNGAPMQLADTVFFNVAFAAPCSDIRLYQPEPDWSFNVQDAIDDGNMLRVTLTDFELLNVDAQGISDVDSLKSIGAEYRRVGTDEWHLIREILRDDIPTDSQGNPMSNEIEWDLAGMGIVDGLYALRAFTRCGAGLGYSGSATGTIDRKPPEVFGSPQPGDAVLSLGEEISITFNEPINCNSVTDATVKLFAVKADGTLEPIIIKTTCGASKLVITPLNPALEILEGRKLRARVEGVKDRFGNSMVGPNSQTFAEWDFDVRRLVFAWTQASVSKTATYLNPGMVKAELVNGSDKTLTYSFSGMPAYLTALPGSDTIEQGKKVEIGFAIQENLAIGAYDAVITAVAMDGTLTAFLAPLSVHIDVVCVPPVWDADPADFEQSMTLVAKVLIDGSPATTKDVVAAFVGNQLRGVAHPKIVPGRSDSLTYITIFSDRGAGETVRFQFFDESACFLYNSADKTYPFVADSRVGSPGTPEGISAAILQPGSAQIVPVNQGWTWISFNRLSGLDMSVNGVLGDLNPSPGDLLKSSSAVSEYDEYEGWTSGVSNFNNTSGYRIRLSEAGEVTLEGTPVPPASTSILVSSGWNWIGFIPSAAIETNEALADLKSQLASGDVIKGQDGFAQYFKGSNTNLWFGSLQMMEPGKGYKLYLTVNANGIEFRYPDPLPAPTAGAANMTASVGRRSGSSPAGPGWTVDPHAFEYDMTVTGTLDLGGAPFGDADAVAAFVGDELRGTTELQYMAHLDRRVFFLMIHGNTPTGERVRFKFYNSLQDEVYNVENTLLFEPDKAVGNLNLPWVGVVTDQDADPPVSGNSPKVFSLAQNIPNPPNPTTNIRYALPKSEHVTMKVYDVVGREVMTLVDGVMPAGWHDVTLDGQLLSSGLYFYKLEAGSFVKTQKMLIVK